MWACILLFITLTVWSIFAVELIQPLMPELVAEGQFPDCNWCLDAFSSVMHANLTFFQIILGDEFRVIARPLMTKHPWTALIFLGVISTMCFGLLNLITAVIVDNAAVGRAADHHYLAHEKEIQKRKAQQCLNKICRRIDVNQNGSISLLELKSAAERVPEFGQLMKIMDIAIEDMECVFGILDKDGSGDVSYEEFTHQLWKMRSQEDKTLLMFVKFYVIQIWHNVQSQLDMMQKNMNHELSMAGKSTSDEIIHHFKNTQAELKKIFSGVSPRQVESSSKASPELLTEVAESMVERESIDNHQLWSTPRTQMQVEGKCSPCGPKDASSLRGSDAAKPLGTSIVGDLQGVANAHFSEQNLHGKAAPLQVQCEDVILWLSRLVDKVEKIGPGKASLEEFSTHVDSTAQAGFDAENSRWKTNADTSNSGSPYTLNAASQMSPPRAPCKPPEIA